VSRSEQTVADNPWLDAARRTLGAGVVAVCPLSHTGFGTRKGLSVGMRGFGIIPSMLAYGASKKASKSKAGGLPDKLLLVVHPEEVAAHGYKGFPGQRLRIDAEPAATWDRSSLQVTTEPGRMMTKVTLDGPGEVEHAECSVGTSAFAEDFFALLRG
jgi:hypothetical protein